MKKLKCKKCLSYFKKRNWEEKDSINNELCLKCRFIWEAIDSTLKSMRYYKKLNREVAICFDDVHIHKPKTRNQIVKEIERASKKPR